MKLLLVMSLSKGSGLETIYLSLTSSRQMVTRLVMARLSDFSQKWWNLA